MYRIRWLRHYGDSVGDACARQRTTIVVPRIGTVESVDSDASLPYNRIIVKPTAPLDRLEHVLVLLVEQKDLKKLEEEVTDTVDKRHK